MSANDITTLQQKVDRLEFQVEEYRQDLSKARDENLALKFENKTMTRQLDDAKVSSSITSSDSSPDVDRLREDLRSARESNSRLEAKIQKMLSMNENVDKAAELIEQIFRPKTENSDQTVLEYTAQILYRFVQSRRNTILEREDAELTIQNETPSQKVRQPTATRGDVGTQKPAEAQRPVAERQDTSKQATTLVSQPRPQTFADRLQERPQETLSRGSMSSQPEQKRTKFIELPETQPRLLDSDESSDGEGWTIAQRKRKRQSARERRYISSTSGQLAPTTQMQALPSARGRGILALGIRGQASGIGRGITRTEPAVVAKPADECPASRIIIQQPKPQQKQVMAQRQARPRAADGTSEAADFPPLQSSIVTAPVTEYGAPQKRADLGKGGVDSESERRKDLVSDSTETATVSELVGTGTNA